MKNFKLQNSNFRETSNLKLLGLMFEIWSFSEVRSLNFEVSASLHGFAAITLSHLNPVMI